MRTVLKDELSKNHVGAAHFEKPCFERLSYRLILWRLLATRQVQILGSGRLCWCMGSPS